MNRQLTRVNDHAGDAIGQLLPFAVGIASSPMPIVAVVLMLVTPRAKVNGPAFVVGWVLGLAVIGGTRSRQEDDEAD